jgi:Zn-dependent alcohol dehydrogenase
LAALVAKRHRLQDINAAIAATKSGDTLRHVIVFD